MVEELTDNTRIAASPDHVSTELEGEIVILDLAEGSYYGLNAVGATIWRLIQKPRTIANLREALLAAFDVDEARCNRELKDLLLELAANGLITISDGLSPEN